MARVQLTPDDLLEHFVDQIRFLSDSCRSFDQGNISEHKRIAATLRVLLYDEGHGRSLLKQLGHKDVWRFLDSVGNAHQISMAPSQGATWMKTQWLEGVCIETRFVPALGGFSDVAIHIENEYIDAARARGIELRNAGARLPFDEWWNESVVVNLSRRAFSRADLVLKVGNQDGGSHVDPSLEADYHDLSRMGGLGWWTQGPQGPEPGPLLSNPVPANIRQIAYEFLASAEAHSFGYE